MSMEYLWDCSWQWKVEYSEEYLHQCFFVPPQFPHVPAWD